MNRLWLASAITAGSALALASASLVAPVVAQPTAQPAIKLATAAPLTLPLKTSEGKPTTLAQHMGAKGVVLVLVRSADWCPYCKAQLLGLNGITGALTTRGYGLASLSYDKPATLTGFAKARSIGFAMLSDDRSQMIDALGLRDPQYAKVPFANGVPYATILVVGKNGRILKSKISPDYKVRPTNADILAMVDAIK